MKDKSVFTISEFQSFMRLVKKSLNNQKDLKQFNVWFEACQNDFSFKSLNYTQTVKKILLFLDDL